MYVLTGVYVYTHRYVCIHSSVNTYSPVHMYIFTGTYVYTHRSIYVYTYRSLMSFPGCPATSLSSSPALITTVSIPIFLKTSSVCNAEVTTTVKLTLCHGIGHCLYSAS